jgi:hypothetical protein
VKFLILWLDARLALMLLLAKLYHEDKTTTQ